MSHEDCLNQNFCSYNHHDNTHLFSFLWSLKMRNSTDPLFDLIVGLRNVDMNTQIRYWFSIA